MTTPVVTIFTNVSVCF